MLVVGVLVVLLDIVKEIFFLLKITLQLLELAEVLAVLLVN